MRNFSEFFIRNVFALIVVLCMIEDGTKGVDLEWCKFENSFQGVLGYH